MKALGFLLLVCNSLLGQTVLQNAALQSFGSASGSTGPAGGSSDLLSQMNPTYVWLSKSLASGKVTAWNDLSNGFALTPFSTSAYPTNNTSANAGVWFNGTSACYLTNAGIPFGAGQNYTVAIVLLVVNTANGSGGLCMDRGGNNGALAAYVNGGYVEFYYSSTMHYPIRTGGILSNTRYDIVFSCSGGAITTYTNGVATAGSMTGVPSWTLACFGGDASNDPFTGYEQKLVVWTNHAASATEAANFHTYCSTNNP